MGTGKVKKVVATVLAGAIVASTPLSPVARLMAQTGGKPNIENINRFLTASEKKALSALEQNLQTAWKTAPKRLRLPADAALAAPAFAASFYTLEEFSLREHGSEIRSYPAPGFDILLPVCSRDSVGLQVLVGEQVPKSMARSLADYIYLEVLSQTRALEGWGLFDPSSVSLLYSKAGAPTNDNVMAGLLAFVCQKQGVDFLSAYLTNNYNAVAGAVEGFFGPGSFDKIRRAALREGGSLGEAARQMEHKEAGLWTGGFASFMKSRFSVDAGPVPQ